MKDERKTKKQLIDELNEMRKSNYESRYISLFENLQNGFALHEIILDKNGKPDDYVFLDINKAFEKQTGLNKEFLIGKKVSEILPGIKNEEFDWIGTYGKVALTGKSITFENYSKALKKWYIVTAYSPAKGRFVTIFQDITSGKELQEQLQQSQKMEAIGTLAGGIAHDFNNILGIIMGYTELTIDEVSDDEYLMDNLTRVINASEKAKEMIQQILDFSRKDDAEMCPINVKKIIEDTMKFLRASIPTTIDININIDKTIGQIKGNKTQITQIIINLCTNATYAMSNGGLLEISLNNTNITQKKPIGELKPGKYQILQIRDTGTGIEKDILKKIFEPYFTTKKSGDGTGMGLAIVYRIIKNHEGYINVYSEQNVGTSFNIYLPLINIDKKKSIF